MIFSQMFICFILIFVVTICGEQFCQKNRKLLLGGIFNYDKTVLAYSWKEVNGIQLWLIWRFNIKQNKLIQIGQSSNVDEVFAGVPLFRTGFGLNLKCSQQKCNEFKDLIFIFFQNSYKVFRYTNEKFSPLSNDTTIPWGLKPKGDVSEWYFNNSNLDNINGIVFLPEKMKLFMVSKNTLYSSPVDVSAVGLKWTKLSENSELTNILGGFVSGTDILFNKNESPDNILIKYNQTGEQFDKISVWKYFNCEIGTNDRSIDEFESLEAGRTPNDKNKTIVTTLLSCIVLSIVSTNIIAATFWISVINKKKKPIES